MIVKKSATAHDLLHHWRSAAKDKRVASFDCFDTLLWRGVNLPDDVFCELAEHAPFRDHKLTGKTRSAAGIMAQRVRFENGLLPEVTLQEVYEQIFPAADWPGYAERCVNKELEIEKSICFVSPGVVDCVREARSRGMKVIVVSDTWLSATQLRALLVVVAPELCELIDDVYCSSDYRTDKPALLWRHVLDALAQPPSSILHIGDDMIADVVSARKFGIDAIHFTRRDEADRKIARRRQLASHLLFDGIGEIRPVWSLYDGVNHRRDVATPLQWNEALGRHQLGPLVFAFAHYLKKESTSLKCGAGNLKFGFLMRDAYLLQQAAQIVQPEINHPALFISRQTAFSASFDSDAAIFNFVCLYRLEYRLSAEQCAKCLLLDTAQTEQFLDAFSNEKNISYKVRTLFTKEWMMQIKARSAAFLQRMLAHIVKATSVVPGDTLCLVDIGYYGTIQFLLRDLVKRHLGVTVVGRYCIYRENIRLMHQTGGLIDASCADSRMIQTLAQPGIAYIEALCSTGGGAVTDYTVSGEPILKPAHKSLPPWMARCQSMALAFVEDVQATPPSQLPALGMKRLQESALAALGSMLFLPSPEELKNVAQLDADVDVGATVAYKMCDGEKGIKGLRRRGLHYITGGGEFRSNTPFEIRYAGLDQLALYITSMRQGLPVTLSELSYRTLDMPVTFSLETATLLRTLKAHATYDGYYAVVIPLGQFSVQANIGLLASWFQIDSVTSFVAEAFYNLKEDDGPQLRYEGRDYDLAYIDRHDGGMLSCTHAGTIVFSPIPGPSVDYIRLVFRPLSRAVDVTKRSDVRSSYLYDKNKRQSGCDVDTAILNGVIDGKLNAVNAVLATATL